MIGGLIDTHTHLYLDDFSRDRDQVMQRALDSGITHLIFPNVDISTIEPMKALASKYPECASMAMGLHPSEIKDDWKDSLKEVLKEFNSDAHYVAVGEIGIDMYWDQQYEEQQMLAFEAQVAQAQELALPIIIHCREGLDQTLEVLQNFKGIKGVFHSFGGSSKDIDRIRNVGDFYFGINGIVTFKNCAVKNCLQDITLERLLLETDSPYLAPVPFRGKRNESAHIAHTAQFISEYLDIPFEYLAKHTTQNAKTLFNI